MPVPVWAALLAVAVAKKVVVFTAAKVRFRRYCGLLKCFACRCLYVFLLGVDIWFPSSISKAAAAGSVVYTRQGNLESRIRTNRLPVSRTKYLVR